MNRAFWQQLADERVEDAKALLDAGRWSAAYYLVGYAVECGLKACVLAYVESNSEVIFQEKRFSEKCWTHDIETLVVVANLKAVRDAEANAAVNLALDNNWSIVKDWDEKARYQQMTETQARGLYEAVTDPANGVLPWIKAHW